MSIMESLARVLGYDASRTWVDFAKAWDPRTQESKNGWKAAGEAFKALGALFSKVQSPDSEVASPVLVRNSLANGRAVNENRLVAYIGERECRTFKRNYILTNDVFRLTVLDVLKRLDGDFGVQGMRIPSNGALVVCDKKALGRPPVSETVVLVPVAATTFQDLSNKQIKRLSEEERREFFAAYRAAKQSGVEILPPVK